MRRPAWLCASLVCACREPRVVVEEDPACAVVPGERGAPEPCDADRNCEISPGCEGGSCDALDSWFDERGCLRTGCRDGSGCGEGMSCYHEWWFDEEACVASDGTCEDDPASGTCSCTFNGDCLGSYCVPDEIYPFGDIGPCKGGVFGCCGADHGPVLGLAFGTDDACGMDDTTVLLVFDASPAIGYFELIAGSGDYGWIVRDGLRRDIRHAWVVLTALDENGVSGRYDLVTVDEIHLSAVFDAIACPLQ